MFISLFETEDLDAIDTSLWGSLEASTFRSYKDAKEAKVIDYHSAAMLIASSKSVSKAIFNYKVDNTPIVGEEANYITSVLSRTAPVSKVFYRGSDDSEGDHIMPFQSWSENIDTARLFSRKVYSTEGSVVGVSLSDIYYWYGLLYGGSNGLGDMQSEWFLLQPKKVLLT